MSKKQKLNLAAWGDVRCDVKVMNCRSCGRVTEEIPAMGIVSLAVCRPCRKFYGLVVEDVTAKLKQGFKRGILTNNKDNE